VYRDESITSRILQAADIVEIVGRHVALRPAGKDFKALCPFHQEKTPSFFVSPSKQIFKCFGCGVGGDAIKFIQLRENVGFLEARAMLAEQLGIRISSDDSPRRGPRKTDLARVNAWAARWFRSRLHDEHAGRVAREYLARRRITQATADRFGLGYAVDSFDSLLRAARAKGIATELLLAAGLILPGQRGRAYDRFRHRLMFPIVDTMDRVVGFGGRALDDQPAKYMNTPETALFEKSRHLFGLPLARQTIQQKGRIVLVEGYTDCVMAHQCGLTETVATLGTALTEPHLQMLRRFAERVVLVFDSDEAGQAAADRALAAALSQQLDVRLVTLPEGQDPCDYLLSAGPERFEALLNSAPSALEFKWRQVASRYEQSTSGPGRHRAIREFLALVASSAAYQAVDPVQRGLVLNQISKLLSIAPEQVHRVVSSLVRQARRGGPPTDSRPLPGPREIDAEQVALREVLEVLLNEPSYYDSVAEQFDPAAFSDPDLAAVARQVVDLARSQGDFRLAQLIARFEEPRFGRLITDLQSAGERRGNFAATIEGAIGRLQEVRAARAAYQIAVRLKQDGGSGDQEDLLRVYEASRSHRHFAPRRHLAARGGLLETRPVSDPPASGGPA